jgi:hypothetical protein
MELETDRGALCVEVCKFLSLVYSGVHRFCELNRYVSKDQNDWKILDGSEDRRFADA